MPESSSSLTPPPPPARRLGHIDDQRGEERPQQLHTSPRPFIHYQPSPLLQSPNTDRRARHDRPIYDLPPRYEPQRAHTDHTPPRASPRRDHQSAYPTPDRARQVYGGTEPRAAHIDARNDTVLRPFNQPHYAYHPRPPPLPPLLAQNATPLGADSRWTEHERADESSRKHRLDNALASEPLSPLEPPPMLDARYGPTAYARDRESRDMGQGGDLQYEQRANWSASGESGRDTIRGKEIYTERRVSIFEAEYRDRYEHHSPQRRIASASNALSYSTGVNESSDRRFSFSLDTNAESGPSRQYQRFIAPSWVQPSEDAYDYQARLPLHHPHDRRRSASPHRFNQLQDPGNISVPPRNQVDDRGLPRETGRHERYSPRQSISGHIGTPTQYPRGALNLSTPYAHPSEQPRPSDVEYSHKGPPPGLGWSSVQPDLTEVYHRPFMSQTHPSRPRSGAGQTPSVLGRPVQRLADGMSSTPTGFVPLSEAQRAARNYIPMQAPVAALRPVPAAPPPGSALVNLTRASDTGGMMDVVRQRRTRSLMTSSQQRVLQDLWEGTRFPTLQQREETGLGTGLSARQVQVWFQNQRQKARKSGQMGEGSGVDGSGRGRPSTTATSSSTSVHSRVDMSDESEEETIAEGSRRPRSAVAALGRPGPSRTSSTSASVPTPLPVVDENPIIVLPSLRNMPAPEARMRLPPLSTIESVAHTGDNEQARPYSSPSPLIRSQGLSGEQPTDLRRPVSTPADSSMGRSMSGHNSTLSDRHQLIGLGIDTAVDTSEAAPIHRPLINRRGHSDTPQASRRHSQPSISSEQDGFRNFGPQGSSESVDEKEELATEELEADESTREKKAEAVNAGKGKGKGIRNLEQEEGVGETGDIMMGNHEKPGMGASRRSSLSNLLN